MTLNVLEAENRFIVGPDRPDAPLLLPPITFGDVEPFELRLWKKAANGSLYTVDLSSYQITLSVGPSNVRPTLGFWQLTTTEGTSLPIASRATPEVIQLALNYAFGPGQTTVTGSHGSYIVTLNANGAWELPTATFQGNTLSSVLVFQITPGTVDTPAQYRIEVLEVAPARIIPANWSAGDVTTVNTFTQVNGNLWKLTLDPRVDAGFFTLTVDGITTGFISALTRANSLQVALAVAGKPAVVEASGTGSFYVSFVNSVAAASIGGNLLILPYQQGNFDLSSTGIRELLDGLQWAPVKLSIKLVKDGTTVMAASADVMLQMPINQPATIRIDAPAMAGLTFAISDDESYLLVYQNAILIGEVPLNDA